MTASVRSSILVLTLLCASSALAQLARTAVSVSGLDTNTCAPNNPCRTFAHAMTQTNAGGEIIALDSGGYGPFVIDKAVSVQAPPGVYAGVTAASGAGIAVTPGQFVGPVMIRNLVVNGTGGSIGIDVSNVFDIFIDKCTVMNFPVGISMTAIGTHFVKDTVVRGGGSGNGIQIGHPTGTPEITLDNVRLFDNNLGLVINDRASVVLSHSVVAQNGSGNIQAITTNPSFLTVTDSLVHGYNKNGEGIRAQVAATVTVTRSTIADCSTPFQNVGATFYSTGDNTITNCQNANGGTISPLPKQ